MFGGKGGGIIMFLVCFAAHKLVNRIGWNKEEILRILQHNLTCLAKQLKVSVPKYTLKTGNEISKL